MLTRVQRSEKQRQLDQEEHEIETDYVCECRKQLQLQITKSQTNKLQTNRGRFLFEVPCWTGYSGAGLDEYRKQTTNYK